MHKWWMGLALGGIVGVGLLTANPSAPAPEWLSPEALAADAAQGRLYMALVDAKHVAVLDVA